MQSCIRSIAVLAAALLATSVSAQPAPRPPPGDRKVVNIASDPLGWALGLFGLSVSVALHDRIALHADANYYQSTTEPVDNALVKISKQYEVGLGVTLYAQRAFSGLLIEPGVRFRKRIECGDCVVDADPDFDPPATTIGPEILVGWQCMLGATFNVVLALGPLYNVNHARSASPIELDGYLRFGFAL